MLSGALVSTLIGLVASNLGIIASEAPAYKVVLEYLMPLAVPLLLYRADMNRVMRSTGNLLLAFLLDGANAITWSRWLEDSCRFDGSPLATIFPDQFSFLAPSSESMALILMQVFFTVIGASGSIRNVISTAPSIFLFSLVQITVHLAFILGVGKLFGFELRSLLIASNANVGGPTTACGMATANGWSSLIIPGILAGIFGIAIATFLGIVFGQYVLKFM
ncbi:uncharacterized protein [Primulina huaijiensis]|uniref:uncharacterized protein n=1 Tax=Primulina huaijiensis TaxID=1492673 RepID=UPI003CC778A5